MSPKKRPKNRAPNRTSTRRPPATPPRAAQDPGSDELPLPGIFLEIDKALSAPHPLSLLSQASSFMATLDPRENGHPAFSAAPDEDEEAPISLTGLCESFMHVGLRQTDAVLKVIAEMTSDELLAERIRRSVASRRHAIPGWTLRLDQVQPYRVVEMLHVLRDGDNIAIGVQLPGKRELSILVYIDHNLGTVVKDAFVLDLPIDQVIDRWAEIDDSDDTEIRDLPFDDARARITKAIDKSAITFPPFETDTWPSCRPLVEWIVAMLPEGGNDYARPEWSDDRLAELTNSFFASTFGRDLDDDDHRSLLGSILWFGTDYGPGDPLRWSPVSAEILLDDWIPRKIVAPADFLAKAPDLLREFVRYSHAERGIQPNLTSDTLLAIDECEAEFQEAIRTPRHQGAMAMLERMGALDGVEPDWDDGLITEEDMLDMLARSVGGRDELDLLDTKPLPDEPFDWSGIADDIHDRVAEVCELVDGCSDALFDEEFRTASRRFLARVAAADPDIFRRKSAAPTAAAAVCWVIGRANGSFEPSSGTGVMVKDVMAHFGVGAGTTKRADPMLRAIGADSSYGGIDLGDAEMLVSAMRVELIDMRDLYGDALDD